ALSANRATKPPGGERPAVFPASFRRRWASMTATAFRGSDGEMEALFWPLLPRTFDVVSILMSMRSRPWSERHDDISLFCSGLGRRRVGPDIGGPRACGKMRQRHV